VRVHLELRPARMVWENLMFAAQSQASEREPVMNEDTGFAFVCRRWRPAASSSCRVGGNGAVRLLDRWSLYPGCCSWVVRGLDAPLRMNSMTSFGRSGLRHPHSPRDA